MLWWGIAWNNCGFSIALVSKAEKRLQDSLNLSWFFPRQYISPWTTQITPGTKPACSLSTQIHTFSVEQPHDVVQGRKLAHHVLAMKTDSILARPQTDKCELRAAHFRVKHDVNVFQVSPNDRVIVAVWTFPNQAQLLRLIEFSRNWTLELKIDGQRKFNRPPKPTDVENSPLLETEAWNHFEASKARQ